MPRLRRLHGLLGLSIATAIAWIPLGAVIASWEWLRVGRIFGNSFSFARIFASTPEFAAVGAVCGFMFGLALGGVERKRAFESLRFARFVALGVAASSTFRSEREATLVPGETLSVAGHTVRLRNVWGREEPQRSVIGANMDVLDKDGAVIGTIQPRMNFYRVSDQPVPTPDVRSGLRGDLYLNLQAFDTNGAHATVKMIVEPLVPWIWFGGFVIVAGAVIGMFHGGRRAATAEAVDA